VQKRYTPVAPDLVRLNRIDYWYWCRYFIDLYSHCPFGCCYCNTKNNASVKGIRYISGLPVNGEVVGLGLFRDIYHPERSKNIIVTDILELLLNNGFGVNIQTKSCHIVHDLEILRRYAELDKIRVTFTILTPDRELSRDIEGNSPDPQQRLDCVELLASYGIPTGIAISPIIPLVNDNEDALGNLVQNARQRGAGWVIFSGFTPVHSFLQNPLMKKVAELYNHPDKLEAHYRDIRKTMIELLKQSNLPMRIPRIRIKPAYGGRTSTLVSEYLFNISYFYELMDNDIEALRYRRAAYRIDDMEQPIKSIVFKKKLGYIKGINPEIERVIEEILSSGSSSLYMRLKESLTPESVG
jgi:DNA repair photolyase